MKRNKKGFTIVELVIVIAVIGVLAAVLIPTFVNLTNKANEASDQSLVKNLNTVLATAEVEPGYKESKTPSDMLNVLIKKGYIGETLIKDNKKSSKTILYALKKNRFLFEENKGTGEFAGLKDEDYWIFSNTVNTAGYSTYLYDENYSNTALEATAGLDVGNNNEFTSISYSNESAGKEVVIRTNGGVLNVGSSTEVAKGKIWHFGTTSKATIYTEDNSFHTHGLISDMDLKAGRAVADSNGMIALMKAAAGTKAEKENGGLIFIPEGTVIGEEGINWVQSGEEGDAKQLETLGYNVVAGKTEATAETKAANSYKIGTKDELIQFRKDWNSGKVVSVVPFVLTGDINISEIQWSPIGNWEYPFNGVFDGGEHTITGLTKTAASESDVYATGNQMGYGQVFGFFGICGVGNIEIKNVTFDHVNINLSGVGVNVGAVMGYLPSAKKFKEADDGNDYATKWQQYDDEELENVSVKFDHVIVGSETNPSSIIAKNHVSGMIGKIYNTNGIEMSYCKNYANVNGVGGYIGGFIGIQSSAVKTLEISNSENHGNITTSANNNGVAGFVGRANDENTSADQKMTVTITNCLNTGSITSSGTAPSYAILNRNNSSIKSATLTGCTNSGIIAGPANGVSNNDATLPDGYLYVNYTVNNKVRAIVPFEIEGNWENNSKVVGEYTVTRSGNPGSYTYLVTKN